MGKRIISQRRGRGTHTYKSLGHRYKANISFKPNISKLKILDIEHDPCRNSPVGLVESSGRKFYAITPDGVKVGDSISCEKLSNIPDGTKIYSIETFNNSGPKLCRSSGSFATVVSHDDNNCVIKLCSRKFKKLDSNCRAIIGIPAGGGRKNKPFLKAGNKWHAKKSRGRLYPRTSGVAMNAGDHPFGGTTKPGHSKTVSRHASQGAKVGLISAKRTGRKKK